MQMPMGAQGMPGMSMPGAGSGSVGHLPGDGSSPPGGHFVPHHKGKKGKHAKRGRKSKRKG